jgi:hypothetical protein
MNFDSAVAKPIHISPPPSPASKHQKTSTARAFTMDNARHGLPENMDLESMFMTGFKMGMDFEVA